MSEEKPTAPPPFKPSVGRIVHLTTRDYTSNKTSGGDYPLVCKAAIVTRVVDEEKGIISLAWFDDAATLFKRNVLPGDELQEETWHSPERV